MTWSKQPEVDLRGHEIY